MAQDDELIGVSPALQAWVHVLSTLGVPTVFASLLLWFVLGNLHKTLELIETQEHMRTALITETQGAVVAALDKQTVLLERQANLIELAIRTNRELAAEHNRLAHPQSLEGTP